MSGRILVVDNDAVTRDAVREALLGEGYQVEKAADGELALARARSGSFDVVLLDIALPGLMGLGACRRMRAESDVPIVIVTARNSEGDRVLGLEAGADDYVGKPFAMAELISRVRAILRRRELDLRPVTRVRRVGDVEIDLASHRVLVAGERVELTRSEFRLLTFLAQEPGRVFTRAEILRHLWHCDGVVDDGVCKAHVSNLRRKIEWDRSRPQRIVTVRGVGYSLRTGPFLAPAVAAER